MRSWWIMTAAFVVLVSTALHAATASQCNIVGPRYRLASDVVDWSMRIEGQQNCSFDFPLNTILSSSPGNVDIENVKLISSPQSGQIIIKKEGFSYAAKADFQGHDSFAVEVSGAINKSHGSSTIRIAVSDVGGVSSPASGTDPQTSLLPRRIGPPRQARCADYADPRIQRGLGRSKGRCWRLYHRHFDCE